MRHRASTRRGVGDPGTGRAFVAAAAVAVALLVAGAAVAREPARLSDSGSVGMRAYVVQAMSVRAEMPEIDVGEIVQGGRLEVDAADADDGKLASFVIRGASGHRWRISVAYDDLVGPGGRRLAVGAPLGSAICFAGGSGPTRCSDGGSLEVSDHGGDGRAHVGYAVEVEEDAPTGTYENPAAIVLTAETILNGG